MTVYATWQTANGGVGRDKPVLPTARLMAGCIFVWRCDRIKETANKTRITFHSVDSKQTIDKYADSRQRYTKSFCDGFFCALCRRRRACRKILV